jgi:methionyl-tRNA synthetase
LTGVVGFSIVSSSSAPHSRGVTSLIPPEKFHTGVDADTASSTRNVCNFRIQCKSPIRSTTSLLLSTSTENENSLSSSSILLGTPATNFDDGKSPFEITTPIYYVNDKPHIGHAYTSTACDVIARFMRLSGREVFFLSGTDEHGQKVEQSAAKQGLDPQDFVDQVSQSFRDLLTLLNISNDEFIRTTSDQHKASVQVRLLCVYIECVCV